MIRWAHASLTCRDLDATEAFYTRWFGFRRAHGFDLGDTRVVFLRLGGAYLELFSMPDRPPTGAAAGTDAVEAEPGGDGPHISGTVRHLAFQTDDLNGFLQRMGDHAKITLGPLDFSDHIPGWRSAWLADPDGVVVEISQGYRDKDGEDTADDQEHV